MLVNLEQSDCIIYLYVKNKSSTDLVQEVMSQYSGKAHPHVRYSIVH
jgi:hypothetical protein